MPSKIVVGGQYGSEGKGKVVAILADRCREPWVVRCGGPNSGHTVWVGGKRMVFRQITSAAGHPNALHLISAGCVIDEAIINREAEELGLTRDQVVVDPRAVLVSDADKASEAVIAGMIGSTASGTGAALIRRMSRRDGVLLVGNSESIRARFRVESVAPLLHNHIEQGGDVIVEGTQGFGLSLLHGPDYPYVTSRDTTAAGFASEVGLSPRHIDDVVVVIRTYPIRVGGRSGPLKDETTWEQIRTDCGAPEVYPEYTSVTQKLRRVGQFDLDAVRRACQYNCPTAIAVMGLDRLDYRNSGVRCRQLLTETASRYVSSLEAATKVRVTIMGTGFSTSEAIILDDDDECRRGTSYAKQFPGFAQTGESHCGNASERS